MGAPSSNKPATATLPSSFTTTTTNFHNTTPATTPSTNKQPRLRASCDGCFLAKVKCTKSRPVCSRCLAVGLVCKYSPSSRSLGGTNRSHDKDTGRSDKRKTRVRRHGGTAVLASTMSEESCAWLAQHAQQWAGPANPHSSSTGYGKGAVDEGYDWDPWLSSVSIVDQGYNGPLSSGSDWLTPESQGWIQFAHPTFGSGMGGEVCWQTMREVNSPFSIGSDEVEEGVGGGFVVNQGQWVG